MRKSKPEAQAKEARQDHLASQRPNSAASEEVTGAKEDLNAGNGELMNASILHWQCHECRIRDRRCGEIAAICYLRKTAPFGNAAIGLFKHGIGGV